MSNRTSSCVALCLVLIASCMLTACGNANAATAPASTVHTPAIVIEDALGRRVEFDRLPQHIVLAGKSFTSIANALYLFPEAAQRIVAMPDMSQGQSGFTALVDPGLRDKAKLSGSEVGPEQIAPVKPDVVVLKSSMADKLGKSLEQIGLKVVYVDLETPEQYVRDVAMLGQLLGNAARATEIEAYYRSRTDQVAQRVKAIRDTDKPKVLVLYYNDKGGTIAFNIAPAAWMQTQLVEMAGGDPIWKATAEKGGWTIVNFEQIAAWNPDQIYIIHYRGDSKKVVDQLKSDPQWQVLKAVKQDQLYGFASDFYSWDQPDTRWILGLAWLAGKIHPALFDDVKIDREMNSFFGELYRLDAGTIQQKIAPNLMGDIR